MKRKLQHLSRLFVESVPVIGLYRYTIEDPIRNDQFMSVNQSIKYMWPRELLL